MPLIMRDVDINELPGIVREAIDIARRDREEGLTAGKKRPDDYNELGHPANVIPSNHLGPCHRELFTYIYDKDSFDARVLESLNLVLDPDKCFGVCRHVVIITTKWDPRIIEKYVGLFKSAERAGIDIIFSLHIGNHPTTFRPY